MTAADPALPIVEAHEAIMVVAEGPMSDDARDLVMERVYELEKAMSDVRPTTMEGAIRLLGAVATDVRKCSANNKTGEFSNPGAEFTCRIVENVRDMLKEGLPEDGGERAKAA